MVGARKHNQLRCYIPEIVIVKGHGLQVYLKDPRKMTPL